jgi:hypothetical protein
MTSSEDLQKERDDKSREEQERYDAAIEERRKAEQYQGDLDEQNKKADDAEKAARGEGEG